MLFYTWSIRGKLLCLSWFQGSNDC